MKINSKTTIIALAALFAAQALADAVVSVSCQQRWPWNGKVDINYILSPSEETCPVYSVKFYASIDGSECFELQDIVGDGACGIALGSGAKRVTWDSNASARAINTENMKIGVAAKEVTASATYLHYNIANRKMDISATLPKVLESAAKTKELWFRRVEPGTFEMGSPEEETGHFDNNNNEVRHTVTITKAYYIGVYEMTQGQFSNLFNENPSQNGSVNPVSTLPATNVSYAMMRGSFFGSSWPEHTDYMVDADSYLGRLREQAKNSFTFDLPTEAQWEMACRAGTDTAFNNGVAWEETGKGLTNTVLDTLGWYRGNVNSLRSVGLKLPNALGLYDMHGGVWEWCIDRYAVDNTSFTLDPVGTAAKTNYRVIRGGAFNEWAIRCRSSRRMGFSTSDRGGNRGVRLAIVK